MYVLTIKPKRNQKLIIATWVGGPDTCIAFAADVFLYHGLKGRTEWGNVAEQKICEYAEDYIQLTDSVQDAKDYRYTRQIRETLSMKESLGIDKSIEFIRDLTLIPVSEDFIRKVAKEYYKELKDGE